MVVWNGDGGLMNFSLMVFISFELRLKVQELETTSKLGFSDGKRLENYAGSLC